ncbi:hypothetical protein FNZ56_03885 [Pseudoluteimonas lycopersici]|uniref:GPI inositol-deacylase PGAP1-like alpha/beta domain-containing protein n=1 Tax=Pseudoluteimonas lycopersici TaxID=1324796 RepID=A0A516V3G8_9GAMM|nr:hypothetical protein [Lysobacter lycopersici]QDQ73071.1 hypothetical protein FNZ56_03885 [Lysobacter lycopersici]
MARIERPFYPIIYVRGYAMTKDEIVQTTSTPYMGFEAGSTKIRQAQDGKVVKFVFESPLVRLMKDYDYRDTYASGAESAARLPARSISIHRYYDEADPAFGDGKVPSIPDAAKTLAQRILALRDSICGNNEADRKAFKVYLVAHSMGGLVCRCLLQNPDVATAEVRKMVDKVFTYATPHNGIEVGGINVPSLLSFNDMNNFNRKVMSQYLKVPADKANTLGDSGYPPERLFCLVGTNSRDYAVAHGLSALAVGQMSDGLVKIENAYVPGSPRAFVNRSHSGFFGIVNSEEGYQNLVRFLFGDICATGKLDITALPFPPEIERARKAGKKIASSYYIEATVAPRGAYTYELTSRSKSQESAMRREYSELFDKNGNLLKDARSPTLFSVFLDSSKIMAGSEVAFSIELAVSNAGYEIDGALFLKQHIPAEYLFRDTLVLFAKRDDGEWKLRYVWADQNWATGPKDQAALVRIGQKANGIPQKSASGFVVPLQSNKGFQGELTIALSPWS